MDHCRRRMPADHEADSEVKSPARQRCDTRSGKKKSDYKGQEHAQ